MNTDPNRSQREEMVRDQIERRGLRQPRLLGAFRRVPRHEFVPPEYRDMAYEDRPLPIGMGQTISQPFIVALMTSLLQLKGDETVLEVGAGSGYQAAILGQLAARVISIELQAALVRYADENLRRLGYGNVSVYYGDGSLGWPQYAPYPAILITAAASQPPAPLLAQLGQGGRLVLPAGGKKGQELQVWSREGERLDFESISPVSFVPLRGQYGWSAEDWPRENDGENWL